MVKKLDSNAARLKRHKRVRAKISGTPERPRLNVFRSAKHIYAQIIDDVTGTTLVSASSMDKGFEGLAVTRKQLAKLAKTLRAKLSRRVFPRSYSTAAVTSIMVV